MWVNEGEEGVHAGNLVGGLNMGLGKFPPIFNHVLQVRSTAYF